MRSIRGFRYLAPLLLGVFVLAQLSGLFPGHYEHTGAGGGHAMMHAPSLDSDKAHHNALGRSGDDCCAVHAMQAIANATEAPSPDLTPARGLLPPERILARVQLTLLDPPPKLPPSA